MRPLPVIVRSPAHPLDRTRPLRRLAVGVAVVTAALALGGGACPKGAQKKGEAAAEDAMAAIQKKEQERAAPSAFGKWLHDADAKVRARAVLAVARLEMLSALDPLAAALGRDPSPLVRAQAAFGLGQIDLAVDPAAPGHQALRAKADKQLVDGLAREHDPAVRIAIIRALGRVSDAAGLDALTALATSGAADERAPAFVALGVSGARRNASRSGDPALTKAVEAALEGGDAKLQAAAAYTAFRQKLKISEAAATAGMKSADTQARIFTARTALSAFGVLDDKSARAIVTAGLKDADWRVQVEALRAARPQDVDTVAGVLHDAVKKLVAGEGARAHVVREACTALSGSSAAPAQVTPALDKAVAALSPTPDHRGEACACAVALDVVAPGGDAVESCDKDAGEEQIARLKVQVAARARTSSQERVESLSRFLRSPHVKVRMDAAAALAADGSHDAAVAAAKALVDEDDFGVAGTLLDGLFESDDNAAALPDSALYKIVERFRAATSFEQAEPLITVATLARKRQTPTARAIVQELASFGEPRVRDAANGVFSGDRAPGPRASVLVAPPLAQLPLYALVKTSRGDIRIAFDREHAPATVANFVKLARAHYYDGTPFHRVIADFVAQGGDKRGDGAGGPGTTIACENSDEAYTRGAVGMATAGKDTGGSQFFFTHSDQPHLDGRYTLFARVSEGLDVMDALQPDDTLVSVDFTSAVPPR